MMPGYDDRRIRNHLLIWWVVWASVLVALVFVYLFFAQGKPLPAPSAENSVGGLIGFGPMILSIVIRWLVLPRSREPNRAFIWFVAGLGLAEACGFLGIFIGGPYRDSLFLLGVLGVVQYVPLYAKKLFDPKGTGFIPNN